MAFSFNYAKYFDQMEDIVALLLLASLDAIVNNVAAVLQ